ncbi:hypothetical protein [Corynebacterium frankenforstense]|uniref:hypothetical protein n=1 Tax=Corynebacterium frankenforstense TaxID=1230998 RepID=UPI0026F08E0B|nr:hypothetical protein [Corynebacterium frankenforstense]
MARHKDTGALADLLGGLAADVDGLIGAVVVELSGSTRLAGGGEAEPAADAVAALARATTSVALSAGASERAGTEPGVAEVPEQAVDALVRAGDRLVLLVPAGREVALGVVVEAAAVDPAVLRWVVTRHLEQTPLAEAAAAELAAAPEPKAVEPAPAEPAAPETAEPAPVAPTYAASAHAGWGPQHAAPQPTVEANATSHDATSSSTPAADGDGARLVEPEPLPGRGGGFDFESWLADYRAGGEKED